MRTEAGVGGHGSSGAQASPLDVMNFLNEVAERYPHAISFASGRPAESLFALSQWMTWVPEFVAYQAERRGGDVAGTFSLHIDEARRARQLGQAFVKAKR